MKKIILLMGCLTILGFSSYAQENPSPNNPRQPFTYTVGVGYLSSTTIVDGINHGLFNVISTIFGSKVQTVHTTTFSPAYVAFSYTPEKRIGVGGSFTYQNSNYDIIDKSTPDSIKLGTKSFHYYTIAAEGTINYFTNPNIRLYGLLGLGFTIVSYKEKKANGELVNKDVVPVPNFQFTPIGISFGHRFGGFAELGFGYRGAFAFGVFYRP